MSSFICSKNHFKKVRDLTYYLIINNKHFIYWDGVNIENEHRDSILHYVNKNIYELMKLNFASVNYQYNCNEKIDDYFNSFLNEEPTEECFYNKNDLSINDLIGLYNAYRCINYQIELSYNDNFVKNIKTLISDNIINTLNNDQAFKDVNKWEFAS